MNHYKVSYSTAWAGVYDEFVARSEDSFSTVEDNWSEMAYEMAIDYLDDEEQEDMDLFANVEEIDEEEYKRLVEEEYYSEVDIY